VEVLRRDTRTEVAAADGSAVRELAHPRNSAASELSVAEAVVPAGSSTHLHLHRHSQEVYCFLSGRGRMRLGEEESQVEAGDTVVIPAGTPHRLLAEGDGPLVLICACSPPYSEEDTEVIDRRAWEA
jgi:mannose-6-phosphate isomerase-like protein (cupin superfamily)